MNNRFFILLLCGLMSLTAFAHDITIKGHVADANGSGIEYVSIHVDSLYTVSDRDGNFSLTIPDDVKADLVVNHISYEPYALKNSLWHRSTNLAITLKEKVNDLADVAIVSGKKQKSIVDKGMRAPGDVTFHNIKNTTYEIGPLFTPKKNFFVGSAQLRVTKNSFTSCTIRLIIYEIKGNRFVPVHHSPLYLHLSQVSDKRDFTFMPEEPIKLLRSHKYYVGVAVMASNGVGEIHFPAYLRKGCVRNLCTDKKKNLPATLGVSLLGVQAK